jgi:hypothetical protein
MELRKSGIGPEKHDENRDSWLLFPESQISPPVFFSASLGGSEEYFPRCVYELIEEKPRGLGRGVDQLKGEGADNSH